MDAPPHRDVPRVIGQGLEPRNPRRANRNSLELRGAQVSRPDSDAKRAMMLQTFLGEMEWMEERLRPWGGLQQLRVIPANPAFHIVAQRFCGGGHF